MVGATKRTYQSQWSRLGIRGAKLVVGNEAWLALRSILSDPTQVAQRYHGKSGQLAEIQKRHLHWPRPDLVFCHGMDVLLEENTILAWSRYWTFEYPSLVNTFFSCDDEARPCESSAHLSSSPATLWVDQVDTVDYWEPLVSTAKLTTPSFHAFQIPMNFLVCSFQLIH